MSADVEALVFAADEHDVASLERLLRTDRLVRATFAAGYDRAAQALSVRSFDVVAAIVGEPGDEGEKVLGVAMEYQPDSGRVMLTSRRAETTPDLAHLRLVRPWDMKKLRIAMIAAIHLRGRLDADRLVELVSAAKRIPSLPRTYLAVREEMRQTDPSVARIGEIVAADPAVTVRILQLVNSAYVGLRREVADVTQATALLGLRAISSLVMAVGVFTQETTSEQRFIERLWSESMQVSGIARRIAIHEGLPQRRVEEAQLGGLLHDIGDLVLFQNWPDQYAQVDMDHRDADELTRFGATHAAIGGYMCAYWGLPPLVTDAVMFHHRPSASGRIEEFNPLAAVHAARAIFDAGPDPAGARFDREYLVEIGADDRIEDWIRLASAGPVG